MSQNNEIGLAKYLENKGYEILKTKKGLFGIQGVTQKNGKKYEFKVSSFSCYNTLFKNEVHWNQQLLNYIKESRIDHFLVPKIYETGTYEDNFFCISSHHPGRILATKNLEKNNYIEKWINKIAQANLFLINTNPTKIRLPENTWRQQNISDFSFIAKEYELQKLLQIINKPIQIARNGVTHGQYLPWHMIEDGSRFVLTNGLFANTQAPLYLDVCSFFISLYVELKNPTAAKIYLSRIKSMLDQKDKSKFEVSIKPTLATSILNCFLNAHLYKCDDMSLHTKLKDDFLNDLILG